ncbi:hypothetical protein, partial [Thauera sp.]|uniref:hypothetical protein n=1 Tax=Thauera sp. TaxID=1905334 RepID=UPI00262CFC04
LAALSSVLHSRGMALASVFSGYELGTNERHSTAFIHVHPKQWNHVFQALADFHACRCTPTPGKNVTLNQLVVGSNPTAPTNEFKHLGQFSRTGLFAFGFHVSGWPRWRGGEVRFYQAARATANTSSH